MYYALGYEEADFKKPMIGVANGHSTITPCNSGLQKLADAAVAGIEEAGGNAQIFGTPTISDGMAMGTEGMKYSLVSREVIADCIETCVGGQWMDGVLVVGGCDKNMPGGMMGMLRANVPAIYVYGGTILPGHYKGQDLNIVSVFEAVGQFSAGAMSEQDFTEIERRAIPGSGSCGGMYTANTMSSAFEALGMSLPFSITMANVARRDRRQTRRRPRACWSRRCKADLKPRDIVTRRSIENAVAVIMATGGSTNAVLHFLAIAHAAGVEWTIDDFERMRRKVPVLCDLKPSGKYLAVDLHRAGGIPQVMKVLLEAGLLHGDCMTITGKTVAENARRDPGRAARRPGRDPADRQADVCARPPRDPEGQPRRPKAAVAKITGLKNPVDDRPGARLRRRADRRWRRSWSGSIKAGDVMVLRYLGPKGAPGMPEMLAPTSALIGQGLGEIGRPRHRRALLRRHLGHGRRPRRARGVRRRHDRAGPARATRSRSTRTGCSLQLDAARRRDRPAPRRLAPPAPRYTRGVLAKFARNAASASRGAVLDAYERRPRARRRAASGSAAVCALRRARVSMPSAARFSLRRSFFFFSIRSISRRLLRPDLSA